MSHELASRTETEVTSRSRWPDDGDGRFFVAGLLEPFAAHAFTSRQLAFRGAREREDFAALGGHLGVSGDAIVGGEQVHGTAVRMVGADGTLSGPASADALVSVNPAIAVAVKVADCVPILLADRQGRAVAAVHAGWRGTLNGVVRSAIEALAHCGVRARDVVAAIGPSIGPCCYQVDAPVRDPFLARDPQSEAWFASDGPGKWKLDLWAANVAALIRSGVPAEAISVARICTADNLDRCFSYRAEGPGTGRLMAAIRPSGQGRSAHRQSSPEIKKEGLACD